MTKSGDFEKTIKELEDIVKQLECGNLSLHISLKQFEKGINLARKCQKTLTQAEQKVTMLTTDISLADHNINHE